jgi:hypothetical protein
MAVNKALLSRVMRLQKAAYAPPGPPAGGAMPPAPPMDPSMMGGAMPPMDPSMMGGAMPPAPPMDPSMMGGAMPPAPPMDPSMVGGLPPDPSMGGAMPPDAGGGAPPVMLSAEDLQALIEQAASAGASQAPEGGSETAGGRVTNKQLMERVEGLESMLSQIMSALGLGMPQTNALPASEPPMEEAPPSDEMAPPPPMPSPDLAAAPMQPGLELTACKQASARRRQDLLRNVLQQLNTYR